VENKLIIYCDGGSRGNPGPAASAYVVTLNKKVIHSEGKHLGIETNNVAEYTAVLLAVDWITKKYTDKASEVVINLDSQLIQRQLIGQYKVKNEKLKMLYGEILSRISKFGFRISFQWGYRDKNELADMLVNKTLDGIQ
jgi:ribonuclease HI